MPYSTIYHLFTVPATRSGGQYKKGRYTLGKEVGFLFQKIIGYLNKGAGPPLSSCLFGSTAVDVFDLLVVNVLPPVATRQLPVLDCGQSYRSKGIVGLGGLE